MGRGLDLVAAMVKLVHSALAKPCVVHAHVDGGAALVFATEGPAVHGMLGDGLADGACAVGVGDWADCHLDLVKWGIGCARHGLFYGGREKGESSPKIRNPGQGLLNRGGCTAFRA